MLIKNYGIHKYSQRKNLVAVYESVMIQSEKPQDDVLQTSSQVHSLTKKQNKFLKVSLCK